MPSFMGMSGDQIAVFIRSVFDGKGFQDLEKAFKKASTEAKKAGGETKSFWDQTAFNIPGLGKDGGSLAVTWGKVAIAAGGAAAAIGAAAIATKKYYDTAKEGAAKYQLEESFNRLASPEVLDQMMQASMNTTTRLETMAGVMTLVAGMSPQVTDEFIKNSAAILEVAKAANKLNPTLGDTDFMFRSLATGIKRSEVRLIDNLGIRVKVDDANRRYAEQIGKNVSALTAEERQIALMNETLRAGQLLIDQVGGSVAGTTDEFMRLESAIQNLRDAWDVALAGSFVGEMSGDDFLNTVADRLRMVGEMRMWAKQGLITRQAAEKAFWSTDDMRQYYEAQKRYIEEQNDIRKRAFDNALEWNRIQYRESGLAQYAFSPEAERAIDYSQRNLADERRIKINKEIAFSNQRAAEIEAGRARSQEIYNKRTEEAADRTEDFAESYGKLNKEVEKHNLEVAAEYIEAYNEALTHTGDSMRKVATEDGGLFTKSIDEIGDTWIRVGGSTADQRKLLEDYQKAAEGAKDELRDWETGLKGFGVEQDKINEHIADAAAEYDYFQQKIADLNIEQGESRKVHQDAVWDIEKIYDALLDANEAAGVSATRWADLKQAVGDWTPEQAFDASKAASLQAFMENIAKEATTGADQVGQIVEHMKFLDTLRPEDFLPYQSIIPEGMTADEMRQQYAEQYREATGGEAVVIKGQLEAIDEQRSAEHEELFNKIWPELNLGETETKYIAFEADPDALVNWNDLVDRVTATEKKYVQIVELPARSGDSGIPQTPSVPPAAAGRRAFANQPYVINEHSGREVFIPGMDGMITQLDRIGGGSTYNFYISNPDAKKVVRGVKDYLRYRDSVR